MGNDIAIAPGPELVIWHALPQLLMVINFSIHLVFNT